MKHKAYVVNLVLLITCIIIVNSASYYTDELEDGGKEALNRVQNSLSDLWKRRLLSRSGFSNRRSSWRNRRLRIRNPWKPRRPTTLKPSSKISDAPRATTPPSPGSEICRNHSKVFRIQDEPSSVVCLRRTSQELLKQLESVGGFLKRYVAVNQSDACAFEDLTALHNEKTKPSSTAEVTAKITPTPVLHRVKIQAVNVDLASRVKRTLPSSPGTLIRGCQGRGTIVDETNLHRLCTECSATTRLSDDRFPNYINEVICQDKDHQCAAKMGMCFQRTLQLSFLRFMGKFELDNQLSAIAGKTVYKEVWESYTQEIRSCCECEMYPVIYHWIVSKVDGDDGDDSDSDEEIQDKETQP